MNGQYLIEKHHAEIHDREELIRQLDAGELGEPGIEQILRMKILEIRCRNAEVQALSEEEYQKEFYAGSRRDFNITSLSQESALIFAILEVRKKELAS